MLRPPFADLSRHHSPANLKLLGAVRQCRRVVVSHASRGDKRDGLVVGASPQRRPVDIANVTAQEFERVLEAEEFEDVDDGPTNLADTATVSASADYAAALCGFRVGLELALARALAAGEAPLLVPLRCVSFSGPDAGGYGAVKKMFDRGAATLELSQRATLFRSLESFRNGLCVHTFVRE